MVDLTRKMLEAAFATDTTITKAQRSSALAVLEGKAPATEPMPRIYAPKEAAKLFGVTPKACRDWARKGLLASVRLGPKGRRGIGYTERSVRSLLEGKVAKATT